MGIHIWDFSQCVVEIYLIFGWESSLERNFLPHQQCGGEKKHCGGKKNQTSSTQGSSSKNGDLNLESRISGLEVHSPHNSFDPVIFFGPLTKIVDPLTTTTTLTPSSILFYPQLIFVSELNLTDQ